MRRFESERPDLAVHAVATAERGLHLARQWALNRHTFGEALAGSDTAVPRRPPHLPARSQMLNQMGSFGSAAKQNGAVTPEQVAEELWQGLQDDRMLILPHPEVRKYYRMRAEDTDRWLRGMRSLLPAADR
jgi:alkylation response protein AidB-like acyl-CoA dehydrogenase